MLTATIVSGRISRESVPFLPQEIGNYRKGGKVAFPYRRSLEVVAQDDMECQQDLSYSEIGPNSIGRESCQWELACWPRFLSLPITGW